MGRLKEARPETDPPALLLVPSERLEALAAEQEAGQCYYGECIFPPAKRQQLAEPSFLLYTNQQFQEHLANTSAQQRLYANILTGADLAAGGAPAPGAGSAAPSRASSMQLGSSRFSGMQYMLAAASAGGSMGGGGGAPAAAAATAGASALPPKVPTPAEKLLLLEDEIIMTAHRMGLEWGRIALAFLPGWTAEGVRRRYQALMEEKQVAQQEQPGAPPAQQPQQPPPQQQQQQQPQAQQPQPEAQQGPPLPPFGITGPPELQALWALSARRLQQQSAQAGQLPLPQLPLPAQPQQPRDGSQELPQQPAAQPAAEAQVAPPQRPTAAARRKSPQAAPPLAPVQQQQQQQPPEQHAQQAQHAEQQEQQQQFKLRQTSTSPSSLTSGKPRHSGSARSGSHAAVSGGPQDSGKRAATSSGMVESMGGHILEVEVDPRCTDPENGELRVCMRRIIPAHPRRTTVAEAHGLESLEGVRFFEEACVVDRDADQKVYTLSLRDHTHCARLDEGTDAAGRPVLSYSLVHNLYQLADGSAWVEHSRLVDADALAQLAQCEGVDPGQVLPADPSPRELFRLTPRYHSRLQNVVGECWAFHAALPATLPQGVSAGAAYFWRRELDPHNLSASPTGS